MKKIVAGAGLLAAVWVVSAIAAESSARKAALIDGDRQEIGEVTFRDTPTGVLIRLDLRKPGGKVSSGVHAVHLHQTGQCEPPFKSAGAHLNPGNKKHGFLSKDGAHTGDLPNIHVPQSGPLSVEMMVAGASLSGGKTNLIDADGFSLVIHQNADDYQSDPAGDSGDRIACAAIPGSKSTK